MRRTRQRTSVLIVASWLLATAALLGVASATRTGDDGEAVRELHERARRLTHENACRRAELELAREDRFYLVLDPEERTLTLKLRGAVLREVALDSVEVGRARRFFVERDPGTPVRGRSHRQGRLAPQRPLIRLPVEIPDAGDEAAPTVMLPPEPESAIAVPERFFVRYEGGVVLEFRRGEDWLDWGRSIADGFSTLFGEPELRLRLGLDRAAAETFYRAVPAETDLLVR